MTLPDQYLCHDCALPLGSYQSLKRSALRRVKHILLAAGLTLAAVSAAAQDGCRQHYDVVTGRVYGCGEDTGGRYPYRPSQPATPAPDPKWPLSEARNLDEEIKAAWTSVFDGHVSLGRGNTASTCGVKVGFLRSSFESSR